MIRIEKTEVVGWEAAIRGMRNPMNSWDKSDSTFEDFFEDPVNLRNYWTHSEEIGPNDMKLMKKLIKAGPEHRKFLRMIVVYCDITAPLYWWKEFDTYKVGTVANSCSTMHKIHSKEFTIDDFSHEHLEMLSCDIVDQHVIKTLNIYRELFLQTKDKKYWWQMIQLLPSSYNQKRTVMMNYEVLMNIYKPTNRQHHKLDEWNVDFKGSFCNWIESLPYSGLITGKEGEADGKPEDHERDCEADSGGIPVLPEQ